MDDYTRLLRDCEIRDDEVLWRRIPLIINHVVRDADGNFMPTSANFKHEEMSVYIAGLIADETEGIAEILEKYDNIAIAAISVGQIRQYGLKIIHDGKDNHAHAIVIGKKKQSIARDLAEHTGWIEPLPNDWNP